MRAEPTSDTLPLTGRQLTALVLATGRQLRWGLRAAACEVDLWRARAARIPDRRLRQDALGALRDKRGHADGAALFWTLPRGRDPALLRVLVRYELLQDLLDTLTERRAAVGPRDAGPLLGLLHDALDLDRGPHPPGCVGDDGGYVAALVEGCRAGCRALPGYAAIRPLLIREAERASVLACNHVADPRARDAAMRGWAERHLPEVRELSWFERTAAASGWITTHALLATAAEAGVSEQRATAVHGAYFPWLAMALTMLDSYADQAEDRRLGDHSYVDHYASPAQATERLCESIERAAHSVRALPDGERHAVLLACMIALYLSKDSARTPELRATTAQIAAAGGSLTQRLLPVLRAWRICNGQQSAT